MIVQDGSTVLVGEHATIEQAYLLARDRTSIQIGKDCMISFQVDIRTSGKALRGRRSPTS